MSSVDERSKAGDHASLEVVWAVDQNLSIPQKRHHPARQWAEDSASAEASEVASVVGGAALEGTAVGSEAGVDSAATGEDLEAGAGSEAIEAGSAEGAGSEAAIAEDSKVETAAADSAVAEEADLEVGAGSASRAKIEAMEVVAEGADSDRVAVPALGESELSLNIRPV